MPWSAVVGAIASGVIGAATADDHGVEAANAAATSATQQQAAIAQDQWDTYKSTYQPLEKAYVADAQNYDSAANRELAAGAASATTSEQFGKARERLGRTPGLDPSSAAYTSSMAGLDMNQAAVDAVGQNAARKGVQDTAWTRRTQALSLGKGLATDASAGLSNVANANARMAASGQAQANSEGASIGRLVSQGVQLWNKPGLSTGNPTSPSNLYSGGNDGWTLPNGESLPT